MNTENDIKLAEEMAAWAVQLVAEQDADKRRELIAKLHAGSETQFKRSEEARVTLEKEKRKRIEDEEIAQLRTLEPLILRRISKIAKHCKLCGSRYKKQDYNEGRKGRVQLIHFYCTNTNCPKRLIRSDYDEWHDYNKNTEGVQNEYTRKIIYNIE